MDRVKTSVAVMAEQDRSRWDAFVEAHPQGTFFHLSAWRGLIEDVFRHKTWFLLAERAGDIAGVLPLAEVKSRLFGHALTSLPFCVYGGAIGDAEAVSELEAEAERIAMQLGVQHLEYRNVEPRHADWPRQDLYVTFRKSIDPDVEANMLAIPRKQRAMVRKGIKNNLTSHIDADVERFFALYADNVLRHGTPALPKRFFAALKDTFGERCEVLTVTGEDGKALSSVLSFYFRDEVLPYYAGDDLAARDFAANDFKYWELMRRACERGCKVFDYGRSKIGTGPYSFKKNWGFEPQPLSYEYRLYKRDGVPQNNPMNPKYRAFIALWRRLPIGVANAIGPYIVRNLG
ncbi:MAG: FemAB family PEP-CTERM system-associated protein [Zoogloeaceae bacterium]|nr:FemAB family PEP-CTERM system-associated protein [Rhodocyclaceae bacterium]MCP5241209.1 FemAB family PEP-CTERM system-associated protein [Zoogloeaceae bacterium]MCP5255112.1 FemAB family PEP-CTERM system-associated protein [Zoogloeaceae bacterium]MCP5294272.1 FemAB family PEP-CTERM system-associated protein [Zoogloeaceae bacterium]MCW5616012.1 FemAB family PEP-CTERM system-associated protein [Rhodocyclaceae bacterium]